MYVVQPYEVGTKERKSLAIIIPAKVARECSVNTSTAFFIHIDRTNNRITLEAVNLTKNVDKENKLIPVDEGFQTPSQPVSSRT
jgi:hypothetical protein